MGLIANGTEFDHDDGLRYRVVSYNKQFSYYTCEKVITETENCHTVKTVTFLTYERIMESLQNA